MLRSLETDHLLHETEVAKILSMKVATLRRWRWSGDGPRFIKVGAAVRYDPQTLKDYLAERERSSTYDPGDTAA
ncbi:MAG: helix-turn-helix domain-containing protein [Proteobacteria bacterium]|nr:helix-turn-helix domain-containing protein [Pseudomonadota bacterium]